MTMFGQHYKGVCDPLGRLVVLLEEVFSSKIFTVKQVKLWEEWHEVVHTLCLASVVSFSCLGPVLLLCFYIVYLQNKA